MNSTRLNKIHFLDDGYYHIYPVIYSDQNLTTEIIYYEEDEDLFEDDEYIELPIIEFPGPEEFEA